MQVKIKLGREWWLLPSNQEFKQHELELFLKHCPYVRELKPGERVRFFSSRPKKEVRQIIAIIAAKHDEGLKPAFDRQRGSIVFISED